ncbi:thiamine pyrophosphate-dependent enzyme [Planctomycetota bacterium]
MTTLKEFAARPELLAPGHRACAGCLGATVVRQVIRAVAPEDAVVVSFATSCIEVSTTIYPYTAWRIPYIHNAFENSAATLSGTEAAYQFLKRKGKISKNCKFIAFGGDGGTYDIGLQSLSGAMERGHDLLYVCYDNEAYMNTGIQRSGATPKGAWTNTTQVGSVKKGKDQQKKDLMQIMLGHHLPYAATGSVHNPVQLMKMVEKALSIEGPKFMDILAPCHRGWRFPIERGVEVAKMAWQTCFWPVYEVENGRYKVRKPKEKLPVIEYLKMQGRFSHLVHNPDDETCSTILKDLQDETDRRWDRLLQLEAMSKS